MRQTTSHTASAVILLSVSVLGCGGSAAEQPAAVIDPPSRTAAEDRGLRTMLVDVAEAQLCDRLEGSLVALPDADAASGAAGGSSPSAGRLWIERCTTERRADRLALRLEGRGWTWVERSSEGPMGSSFTVRGHLRFETEITLEGEVDIAYAPRVRVISVWLTPRQAADAVVRPTGAVPVEPDGGWSSFVGALGGLFGESVEERAIPMVEEQGSQQMAERLGAGFTFTIDLCTGQADSLVGALGNGEVAERPYPADGTRWLANQRVRLRHGGLDAAGPFEADGAPVRVDLAVEEGAPVLTRAYCVDDAREVVASFLEGRPAERGSPLLTHRAERGAPSFVELDTSECPVVLVWTRQGGEAGEASRFRYRVHEVGATADPVVLCE